MLPWSCSIRVLEIIEFFLIDLTISGMILFSEKSPPPITFPALATAMPRFFLLEFFDEFIIISAKTLMHYKGHLPSIYLFLDKAYLY